MTQANAAPAAATPAAATPAAVPPATSPSPSVSAAGCTNPDALGVARTVEIDTTGGPGFGLEQYKAYDFLEPKEVVLTFDDGPQVRTTKAILDALAAQCTKAIFFSIGKMAIGMPEIIREVVKAGHTVGTHTWSHADIRKKPEQEGKDEIEKGISGVRRAVGGPIAPFFRYPYLRDSPASLAHLASRNIAIFSMDVDSFDFKPQTPEHLVKSIMDKLDKKGKGIILMHDIQPHTAKALPTLLAQLKAGGYKVVHMKPAAELKTLADYDALIEKDVKGLPATGSERPVSSIVRTVPNSP
jgi:peptidoglycan/xylan/chitin deacetylase (PgdA/CDA1 family)